MISRLIEKNVMYLMVFLQDFGCLGGRLWRYRASVVYTIVGRGELDLGSGGHGQARGCCFSNRASKKVPRRVISYFGSRVQGEQGSKVGRIPDPEPKADH